MIVEWITMSSQETKVKENINYIDDVEADLFIIVCIVVNHSICTGVVGKLFWLAQWPPDQVIWV